MTRKSENPSYTRSVFHFFVFFWGVPQFLIVTVTEGKLSQPFPGWENRWSLLEESLSGGGLYMKYLLITGEETKMW